MSCCTGGQQVTGHKQCAGFEIVRGLDRPGMIGRMDITSRAEFAADPQTVYTMLTTREYLERLVAASSPIASQITVDGGHTITSRTIPAPSDAAKFTGPKLTVVEDLTWGEPAADGSRTAAVGMTVPKQPVSMKGTVTLAPGGKGSVVDLKGDLKVNVPLLGRKLEASAAPAVLAGFADHQQVGDAWLAEHS